MSTPRVSAVRGTNDILPDAVHRWQWLEGLARERFRAYGFDEIRTPIFEVSELFAKHIGESTEIVEKEMYSFQDRKGRDLSLRPEGTAGVVRAYLEHRLAAAGGLVKLYYIGPMFRYERPQEGRSRQFHQIGVEALGSMSPHTDFEIISLIYDLYRTAGLKALEISLNNVGSPECKARFTRALVAYLEPQKSALCPDCLRRLEKNPLRVMDCKVETCRQCVAQAPRLRESLSPECLQRYETVQGLLTRAGVPFRENDRLVRGLDYYNETVFEVSCPLLGAKDAIAGGGRYNHLVESLGGPPTGAAGFGIGIERTLLALERDGALPAEPGADVFVAYTGPDLLPEAFAAARALRALGLRTEVPHEARSLKNQFKAANLRRARYVVLVGEEEKAAGKLRIKNMESGGEELLDAGALDPWARTNFSLQTVNPHSRSEGKT